MAQAAAAGLAIGSTLMDLKGQREQTAFDSAMADRKATLAKATSQRRAMEARRQGDRTASDAQAVMAGSGGVTDDAGAVEQIANIKATSDYNALAALYSGNTEAKGLQIEDKMRRKASKNKQIATALGGASKAYGAYNGAK
jgi:hypothetical protein